MAQIWVATAPIYAAPNIRAYNRNDTVPDSAVTAWGLVAAGLVTQVTVPDGQAPDFHGTDPVLQSELSALTTGAGRLSAESLTATFSAYGTGLQPTRVRGKMPPSKAITTFQAGHGWGFGSQDPSSNLNDTATYSLGSQCATAVTKGDTSVTTLGIAPLAASIDLTQNVLRLRFRATNLLHTARFEVYAGSGGAFTNMFWWKGLYKQEVNQSVNYSKDGEWVDLDLSLADATVVGTPVATTINALQLRVGDDGQQKVTINWQGVYAVPKSPTYPNGVISFTWDDSVLSPLLLAKPKLDAYGWLSTYYCILDVFGTTDVGGVQYMTLAQAQELYRQGHDVSPHCTTLARHSSANGLVDLTPTQLEQEFRDLKAWAYANGFTRSADHFCTPQGRFSSAMIETMRRYFASHRTLVYSSHETVRPSDPLRLRQIALPSVGGSITLAQVMAAIDSAVANGAWLILTGHQIIASGTPTAAVQTTQADFNTIADHIASTSAAVRTVSQVLNDMA